MMHLFLNDMSLIKYDKSSYSNSGETIMTKYINYMFLKMQLPSIFSVKM